MRGAVTSMQSIRKPCLQRADKGFKAYILPGSLNAMTIALEQAIGGEEGPKILAARIVNKLAKEITAPDRAAGAS